jgi:hypothetical protein
MYNTGTCWYEIIFFFSVPFFSCLRARYNRIAGFVNARSQLTTSDEGRMYGLKSITLTAKTIITDTIYRLSIN